MIHRRVEIDTRSLAVFRVLLGGLVIADLLLRARQFSFYYTDDGVVTQEMAKSWTDSAFSLFYYASEPTVIALLFVVHGLVALVLIAGYRTRIATVVTFLFVVSLDHHNPLVLSYADTLFRLLFFWAIFLPLGERWSVDAVQRQRGPRGSWVGLAGVFALLQMVLMYFANGLHKFPSDLWQTGEGTPLIFGIDQITFLLGDAMGQFPFLLEVGGRLWFYLLLTSPFLLLLAGRWRVPLVGLMAAGHASFALTVRIGAFAYVAIAGLVLFVQTPVWEDGKRLLSESRIDTVHLRSLAKHGERFARPFPEFSVDMPGFEKSRDVGYSLVVGLLTVGIALVVASLVFSYAGVIHDDVPDDSNRFDHTIENTTGVSQMASLADYFGVDQPQWAIFANPHPETTDRYYVFPAKTADGEQRDLYFGRNLTYERPYQDLQRQYETYRMRFYMSSISDAGPFNPAPERLIDHLCETWREDHDGRITHINMYEVTEQVTRDTIDTPSDRERHIELLETDTCSSRYIPREFAPPEPESGVSVDVVRWNDDRTTRPEPTATRGFSLRRDVAGLRLFLENRTNVSSRNL